MRNGFHRVSLFVAFVLVASSFASASTIGPDYPPPGGVTLGGSGSVANTGGRTFVFSGLDQSLFTELYWGLAAQPRAALDGSLDLLGSPSVNGNVLTYTGVTSWNDADPVGGFLGVISVPIKLEITLISGASWVTAATAGVNPSLGYVADVNGSAFTAHAAFFAKTGNNGATYIALNAVPQFSSGLTKSDFGGGFYYVEAVPDAGSTIGLLSLALAGLAAAKRRFS